MSTRSTANNSNADVTVTDGGIVVPAAQSPVLATTMEVTEAVAISQQTKVTVMVPLIPGEKNQPPVCAYLNGQDYKLLRGVPQDLPEEVYLILVRAGEVTPCRNDHPEDWDEYPRIDEDVEKTIGGNHYIEGA